MSARFGPLVALARTHLGHSSVTFDPQPDKLRLAAVYTGIGLDHLAGEEVVALADDSEAAQIGGNIASWFDDNWEAEHYDGALLTTRRLVIGGIEATAFPLDGLQAARVRGSILKELEVVGVDEQGVARTKSHAIDACQELSRFVQALAQVPPPSRTIPTRAPDLVQPSGGDPSGALAAAHALGPTSDPRAATLLRAVGAAVQRGAGVDASIGADLARRAVLFERNERLGRGMRGGAWLSPLGPEDFETICHLELGAPRHRFVDPSGALSLGFRYDSSIAAAAASTAAGLAAAEVIGIGWTESPVSTLVDVRLVRMGAISGFSLRAASGERFTIGPRGADLGFVQAAHRMVSWHEARALLLRVLFGWRAPLHELLRVPPMHVDARARELLGPTDLAPFAARPDGPDRS